MKLNSSKIMAAPSLLAAIVGLASVQSSHAAVSFTGSLVEVNFDSMAGNAGVVPFSNDTTIPGLYLYLSGGISPTTSTPAVAGVPDMVYRGTGTASAIASNNSTTYPTGSTFAFYFYRPNGSTDLSLGLYNSDSNSTGVGTGYIAAGIALVNNTGQSIPTVSFTYSVTGSSATNLTNPDPVSVSYAYNAAGVADANGTWTTVDGMGYSVSGAGVLTGPTTTEISGLSWAPGETLFIRFKDTNVGSTDRLSFIDDIQIIPEPSSLLLSGLGALGLAMRRRIHR